MKKEYVVALENKSGEVVKTWVGGFRTYDETKVTQWKVKAETETEAGEKAKKLHKIMKKVVENAKKQCPALDK